MMVNFTIILVKFFHANVHPLFLKLSVIDFFLVGGYHDENVNLASQLCIEPGLTLHRHAGWPGSILLTFGSSKVTVT